MAYVRGHPGDFDSWAAGGADGWSYEEVLPYFLKAEGFVNSPELHADPDAGAPAATVWSSFTARGSGS